MASVADTNLIQSLEFISVQLNRYLSPVIFTFGTVGNILSCLVLLQLRLRSNPCAVLFLVSSFVDLISILIGMPTRILSGWNLDPTSSIHWICKLRAFIVFSTRTMAIWLITLATIDRWLLSCIDVHRRRMNTLKNAKRGILATLILSIISYIHMFYCYEANLYDTPLQCYGKNQECRLITDLIYALITIIIPLILMIIFGLMTISNVHLVHIRAQSTSNISLNTRLRIKELKFNKRVDRQLLRMLLVEIIFLIVLCIPQAIQKFYITFKTFDSGSGLEDVIKTFLYNIELLLAFIASGMPFYIYILAGGSIFRKAFIDLIRVSFRKITYLNS
jgi:hypothetical protein